MAGFGCAGVNLDYCRYPVIVGYDAPLISGFETVYGTNPTTLSPNDSRWVASKCQWIDGFMASARQAMNTAGVGGHPVKISVRLPSDGYTSYGLDPKTWISQGSVDTLIPAYPGEDVWYDVLPWIDMTDGTNVTVSAGIEYFLDQVGLRELTDQQIADGVTEGTTVTYALEDYLRRSSELYASGVDSLYLFNNFVAQPTPNSLNQLGDKNWVRKWSEFYDGQKLRSEIITIQ